MRTEDLIILGKEAKELLAKFPYLNAQERKYHERVAMIGKLAENGGVTMRCDRAEVERLQAEIKTEVTNMRK